MFRSRFAARGLRSGMTLIELVTALAALGLVGCLLLANSRLTCPPASMVAETPAPFVIETLPAPPPPPPVYRGGELSLQATLDRLGYTVNVPAKYEGCVLARNGYRCSSADDSVPAGWFRTDGEAVFQVVSQQSSLCRVTEMVSVTAAGERTPILGSDPESQFWVGQEGGRSATIGLPAAARLAIEFSSNGWGSTWGFYSTPGDNESGIAHLIVLPARTGGRWVEASDDTGYWEGGEENGDYLLCWEDLRGGGDRDFQDLVVLVRGLRPVTRPSEGL
jgi:prepilin-type N-terminal cleavage/methylation domain-containing protein